jgi:hypothetical protein
MPVASMRTTPPSAETVEERQRGDRAVIGPMGRGLDLGNVGEEVAVRRATLQRASVPEVKRTTASVSRRGRAVNRAAMTAASLSKVVTDA